MFGNLLGRLRHAPDSAEPPYAPMPPAGPGGQVMEAPGFDTNPGDLTMKLYIPPSPPRPGAPLLVLLHGCGQDAVRFAAAAGWMALADRLAAPLLLPEQAARNNQGRCFNWFEREDIACGAGEGASIRQMVGATIDRAYAMALDVLAKNQGALDALAAVLFSAGYLDRAEPPQVLITGGFSRDRDHLVSLGQEPRRVPPGPGADVDDKRRRRRKEWNEP